MVEIKDQTSLTAIIEILEELKICLDGEAPINRALTFLYLARGDLSGVPEDAVYLVKHLNLTKGTVHRHIQSLTDWHRYGEGKSYLDVLIDPEDRRRRIVKLTPKGLPAVKQIIRRFNQVIGRLVNRAGKTA